MSTIFISHSSSDRAHAEALSGCLRGWKYDSLFLDFDPVNGIPPGRDWHREIYRALRRAQAVIFLCSPASLASHWCFAELAEARSAGKHLFPLLVAALSPHDKQLPAMHVIASLQMVDLTNGATAAGYELLRGGLALAGLDPVNSLTWDPKRSPYPGMMSFAEEDAAVYFGRERETDELLDRLGRMQLRREPLLAVVFGGSGSGKSSLVRAGVVPRLRRDRERWLVVPPFRPRQQPRDELARALAAASGTADWKAIRASLDATRPEDAAAALMRTANDLRMADAAQREASVLLVIDQLEELFAPPVQAEATAFFALLRAALAAPGSPLLAVATMRSEFFSQLQSRPELTGFAFESFSLGPMAEDSVPRVITGPAERAGIDIDPGLVPQMITDMESEDALPLLAFTLRQLYERCSAEGRLTERAYTELGGVKGAVRNRAEEVIAANRAAVASDENALRIAFLDHLSTLNDDGQLTRRTARWNDIPAAAHPMLRALCEERLLVSSSENGAEVLEVAHEALFRVWTKLAQWLDSDREFLFWRRGFRADFDGWYDARQDPDRLLRGSALSRAQQRLRQHPDRFSDAERAFVRASQRQRWLRRSAVIAAAVLIGLTAYGFRRWTRYSDQLIDTANERQNEDPRGSVALAAQVVDMYRPQRGIEPLRRFLGQAHTRALLSFDNASDIVTNAVFAPDGTLVCIGGTAAAAQVWRLSADGIDATPIAKVPVEPNVQGAAFSPDDQRLVIADRKSVSAWDLRSTPPSLIVRRSAAAAADVCRGELVARADSDGVVRLWNLTSDTETSLPQPARPVSRLLFNSDCSRLAVEDDDGVRVWDVERAQLVLRLSEAPRPQRIHFSPDGQRILAVTTGQNVSEVVSWDATIGKLLDRTPLAGWTVTDAAFSPDGAHLAAVSAAGALYIWDVSSGTRIGEDKLNTELLSVAFSPGGMWLTAGGSDHAVHLWSAVGESHTNLRGHSQKVDRTSFSPDGRFILSGSRSGARLWEVGTDSGVLRKVPYEVSTQAVSPRADETLIAIGDLRGVVRLVGLDTPVVQLDDHGQRVTQVAFSANGGFLVSASEDGTARVWERPAGAGPRATWHAVGEPLTHGGGQNVSSAAVGSSGALVVTAPDHDPPLLWKRDGAAGWQSIGSLGQKTGHLVALSPDERWVAIATDDEVWISQAAVGAPPELVARTGSVSSIAFSPDGQRILVASEGGRARIWRVVERGKPVELLPAGAATAAFSADGRVVVTTQGTFVHFWNVESGDERTPAWRGPVNVTTAALTGGGRYLAVSSGDNYLTIYPWATFAPTEALRAEVDRLQIAVPSKWEWLWK